MAELIEIGEQQERVILFAASTNASDDTEESVEELRELVKTAGAETVGAVIQNRENIHPGTYLGKRKGPGVEGDGLGVRRYRRCLRR